MLFIIIMIFGLIMLILLYILNKYNKQLQEIKWSKITLEKELETKQALYQEKIIQIHNLETTVNNLHNENKLLSNECSVVMTKHENLLSNYSNLAIQLEEKTSNCNELSNKLLNNNQQLNQYIYQNQTLEEKNHAQQKSLEDINKKFILEFENIANSILDKKSEKFTELNEKNINKILEPLGNSINSFKDLITNVYDKESKERFSLGEKVKDLAELNKQISLEASNLTKALKGDYKLQGNWGEMILNNILDKSGLRKNEEYFLQQTLKDAEGNYSKSENNKKMIPDVIIKYPDNRHIIIDAKVSINAFLRASESINDHDYNRHIQNHVTALKKHINDLSHKGYDDYTKSLDFVLMFIPSEAAYIAALQNDNGLWEYAYDKRILLINPTNLIACLKLISDLWKREAQSQNALLIAEKGAKMYDKFVGFIATMESIGQNLKKANDNYDTAYKQLYTGRDNLIKQSLQLKELGVKNKKQFSQQLMDITEE